jgi:Uma2 family endonuclease
MATLVTDPAVESRILAERQAIGADRYDEVWEGVYMMNPIPNDEHQDLVMNLSATIFEVVTGAGLGKVRPGVNLSDRDQGWAHNYRAPDVVAFLNESSAKNFDSHWTGAADFLVEIISPGDRSREKLDFYGKIGVRELLLVDRYPWAIELYRGAGEVMNLVGRLEPDADEVLKSEVLPLSFRLIGGEPRPRIKITHHDDDRQWSA